MLSASIHCSTGGQMRCNRAPQPSLSLTRLLHVRRLIPASPDISATAQHSAKLASLRYVLSSCQIRCSRPPPLTRDLALWLGFQVLAPTPAAMSEDELGEGMIMVAARSAMVAATSTSSLSFILMSQDKEQKRRVHPLLA